MTHCKQRIFDIEQQALTVSRTTPQNKNKQGSWPVSRQQEASHNKKKSCIQTCPANINTEANATGYAGGS